MNDLDLQENTKQDGTELEDVQDNEPSSAEEREEDRREAAAEDPENLANPTEVAQPGGATDPGESTGAGAEGAPADNPPA